MAVKDPSTWAQAWGSGVQSKASTWSKNYIAAGPSIFTKAAAAVGNWQMGVSSAEAAKKYVGKLNKVNFAVVTATVNGAGQQKYAQAGVNKQANYQNFANVFGPKLSSIVSALPARGPRGSAVNRTRLNQLLDQIEATKGTNF